MLSEPAYRHAMPRGPEDIDLSSWEALRPPFDALLQADLDEQGLAPWLEAWSGLSEMVRERASLLSIAYSQDTTDEARREAYLRFLREVSPHLGEVGHALEARLLETGAAPAGLETTLRAFRGAAEIYREENVPLQAELRARATDYGRLMGGLSVDFEGEERTLEALQPFLALPERPRREAAWRAGMAARLSLREELDELFDDLLARRETIARNAGFDGYRDYQWQALGRHDYRPEDGAELRASIRDVVVPALRRQAERRRADLGLEALRPWDLDVDARGGAPLRPFDTGAELAETGERIFARLSPTLGGYVREMRDEDLLDLDNRKGKAPGGYCATLSARRKPFIFMNAVGTDRDVRTLLHELGHAFHVFEAADLPYIWQRRSPMEFAEVASMTMELLTQPYLGREEGGFYAPEERTRALIAFFERIISFLPYMAVVDGFQDWLYTTDGARDAAARDQRWLALHRDYCVEADWSGLEAERSAGWQHKLHIFQAPLYYIEYGLAQLGALQVWRNSLEDPEAALAAYRGALALGGTRTLPELFQAAGARLAFDADTIATLVASIESTLADLRAQLAPRTTA